MPADRSEIKQVDYAFSENGNVNFHIFELLDYLNNLNSCLSELDELLMDGGIDGIDHKNFGEDIEYSCEMLMELIGYSATAATTAGSLIDLPLYEGFNHHATEALSRIHLDDYSIENNLGICHTVYRDRQLPIDVENESLKIEDFVGLTMNTIGGGLSVVPEEFRQFTDIYSGFYESYKESMTDEEGNLISLEEYLEMLAKSGEFSHKMNKPFLSLLENVTDMLIVFPIIEAISGYELWTGEDLSAFERGMKGASAIVCVYSYGNSLVHMSMSAGGITGEKLFAAGVKELTSNTVTYLVGYSCDELGLPVPVCILIATSTGIGVDMALDDALLGVLDSYNISAYDVNIQKPIEALDISNPHLNTNPHDLNINATSLESHSVYNEIHVSPNGGSSPIDLTIMSRNSGRGNPSAIMHFDVELNTRQINLLQQLPTCDASILINRGDVNLKDLAALTAATGDEFALFTRGSQRMIVRGNVSAVNIDGAMAQELHNAGFRWSGHTHPGIGGNVRFASEGDMYILEQFNQTQSVILDSHGNYSVFEIGD